MMQELNIKAWAAAGAFLWGGYLFLAPLLAMRDVGFFWFSSEAFGLLSSIYPGLRASVGGAFIGLAYGTVCGALCSGLFAGVHNTAMKWFR